MTISLPAALRRQVARSAKARHLTQSEYVRAALQEKLWEDAVEASARMLAPKAKTLGLLAEEDVFKSFS